MAGPTPASRSLNVVRRRFDHAAVALQFAERTRLELGRVLRGPFFPLLLLLGLGNVVGSFAQLPADATLADRIARVDEAFRLVPIVVATFWAGELVWGERDVGLDEIIGSSPIPGSALVLSKTLTLILILVASLGTAALAASGLEVWRTGAMHPDAWLLGFALPRTWDAGLLAILAVFFQTIAPGKLAGFGLMVLYLISALALETMGFHGDLYRYGGSTASLDLARIPTTHALLVRAYWGAAALLLLLLAQKLASRGLAEQVGSKVRRCMRQSSIFELVLAIATSTVMITLASAMLFSDRLSD